MELIVRQERIKRKWTQEYVALQIGTTLSTVQKIECGNRKPSFDILVKLLSLFEYTDPRELFREVIPAIEKEPDGNKEESKCKQ